MLYTSFGISGDIDKCHAAVQEQRHNLIDFRDSLGAYNQGVIEMEDNLVSKLRFIQESTNMSFKTDYDSEVNVDAEIMLIYISSLLTKRIDELSDDEKAYLEKVENMLGVENYKKLKELIWSFMVAEIQNVHVMDEKKLEDSFDKIKNLLENNNDLQIIAPNIPLISHEDENDGILDWVTTASKSWDSVKEIASDLWKGVEIRGSKWNDSPYDFVNWLTLGIPDVFKSWGQMNYQNGLKAFETRNVYDIGNWLTSGQFDMIKGTFDPSEPFSKEYWLDSLGTASLLFGLRNVEGRKTTGPNTKVKEESITFKSMEMLDIGEGKVVWNNIKITQPMYDGTKIPKSFELTASGEKFWVHPNGTKHMVEYITREPMSHGMPINSQTLLSSFQNSVSDAVKQGIKYDEIMNAGNWELIFSKPRGNGLLPVIKHAVYRP